MVTVLKPKVIDITESCSEGKSEGGIILEGFTPYRDDRGIGVILYIEYGLQSAPSTELNYTHF